MIKKKVSHSTCCVVNCKNNGRNSECKFYSFPKAQYKVDQRKKWIAALKRINPDGSPWHPKPSDSICNAHFSGNQKSNDLLSPSYIPTIFPNIYRARAVNEACKINRHARFIERRRQKIVLSSSATIKTRAVPIEVKIEQLHDQSREQINEPLNSTTVQNEISKYVDKACQVYIIFDSTESQKTFICNRYIYNSSYNDVEIQTEIVETTRKIIVPSQKKFKDKKCGTPQKTYVDQSLEPILINDKPALNLCGFSPVKTAKQTYLISYENSLYEKMLSCPRARSILSHQRTPQGMHRANREPDTHSVYLNKKFPNFHMPKSSLVNFTSAKEKLKTVHVRYSMDPASIADS